MKFCGKNVLCEKGDEITRFDGIAYYTCRRQHSIECENTRFNQIVIHPGYILQQKECIYCF